MACHGHGIELVASSYGVSEWISGHRCWLFEEMLAIVFVVDRLCQKGAYLVRSGSSYVVHLLYVKEMEHARGRMNSVMIVIESYAIGAIGDIIDI